LSPPATFARRLFPTGKPSGRKLLRWAIVLVLIVVAVVFGLRYWTHGRLYISTDNAYVNAHTVEIAPQVSGAVTAVHVRDNGKVARGEPLFDIDPQPYRIALDKAEAQLALARQSVSQESAGVVAAEAEVKQREAELRNARSNVERTAQLVRQGFLSRQGGESAATQLATAQAALQAARANVEKARSALGEKGNDNAAVRAAEAAVRQAQLDLQHTRVTSPTAGSVANLNLRPGNTVQAGVPLFVVIASDEYWVDANFKETELQRIHPGQHAEIHVDMYPDQVFEGVVESVSGGSGTAFSLLPPQNATGNWVKVTQRVPVRIRVLDPDPQHPLRIQTTASVEVRTAPADGREVAQMQR
jgi:membrane fusion protein (multidrug efflux system)